MNVNDRASQAQGPSHMGLTTRAHSLGHKARKLQLEEGLGQDQPLSAVFFALTITQPPATATLPQAEA
jgi:hypothetical protein